MAKKHDPAKSVKSQIARLRRQAIKVKQLQQRLIRKQGTPTNTIETGRVGVEMPADFEATIRRVLAVRPAQELTRALADLAAARDLARRIQLQASQALAKAPGEATAVETFLKAGGAAGTTPVELGTEAGGLQVLFDWLRRLPHTLRDKNNRPVATDKWISDGFLVFDPRIESPQKGSVDNPWFGIRGPSFRCYYPDSGLMDWESCFSSGSSGRWLQGWSQKSNYVKF